MADEASVELFLDFLRSVGIADAQLPTFRKVAEQLLIGTGCADLRSVSAEQANRWREGLRARNLSEQQMALISRGISAVQAFQRKQAGPRTATPTATPVAAPPSDTDVAPPRAPTPPPQAAIPGAFATPPRRPAPAKKAPPAMTAGRKWATIGVLALVLGGSVVYTVVASRNAMQETRGDKVILTQRQAVRKIGMFYPSFGFSRQPAAGCQAGALELVNRAVDIASKAEGYSRAVGLLDEALAKDPSCVSAARVLTILEFKIGGGEEAEKMQQRFQPKADGNPTDAPAQLMAAYAARQAGDGEGYRKYLDRAQAADPHQPLLASAWGVYWDIFAQPRDFTKELAAEREEVQASSDPGTMMNLVTIYLGVGDYDRAKELCNRFYGILPGDQSIGYAMNCLAVALREEDAEAEKGMLKRYAAAPGSPDVSPACRQSDLAGIYLKNTCRFDEALRLADLAIEQGCLVPGSGQRREALIGLRRYEEAAQPPPSMPGLGGGLREQYWDGRWGEKSTNPVGYPDRDRRALALAMVGRDQEARAILRPIAESDEWAQILLGMIEEGTLKRRVADAPDCGLRTERSERLAGAAGGYIGYKMLDDAWPLQDAAMALNPRSPVGWANKVYMLSIDGKLQEAAQMGEKALALGIDDPYLAGNIGYVYQQLGDCDKAIPLFKRKMLGQPWTVPNYTNLAKCLDKVGRGNEAALMWGYVQGGKPRVFWWMYVALVVGAVGLYIGGKLALIKLLPDRFGDLKFP